MQIVEKINRDADYELSGTTTHQGLSEGMGDGLQEGRARGAHSA
jgi:hypothetical protein